MIRGEPHPSLWELREDTSGAKLLEALFNAGTSEEKEIIISNSISLFRPNVDLKSECLQLFKGEILFEWILCNLPVARPH